MEAIVPVHNYDRLARPGRRYSGGEHSGVEAAQTIGSRPPTGNLSTLRGASSHHRSTIQWPFLHHGTDDESETETDVLSSRPLTTTSPPRRATWQPGTRNSSGSVLDNVVPDYVVNYMRGDTPEIVTKRKQKKGSPGPGTEAARQHPLARQHTSLDSDTREGTPEQDALQGGDVEKNLLGEAGHDNTKSFCGLVPGWRGGVAVIRAICGVVLLATIVLFAAAMARERHGETRIYQGPCETSQRINFGIHAAISLIVMALLMSANYVFQLLTSPTRIEVDTAHDAKKWVDIGVPSFRNIKFIARRRGLLASILLFTACVSHVIYNSIIFTTQFVPSHNALIVTESFLDGAAFSNDTDNNTSGLGRAEILALRDAASRNSLTNLTTSECMRTFDSSFQTDFDAVLLVTAFASSRNSLLQTIPSLPLSDHLNNAQSRPTFQGGPIAYCLAQGSSDSQPVCALDSNDGILGTAILVAFVCVACTALLLSFETYNPLATLGDAIASFLEMPDRNTIGSCFLTKDDIKKGRRGPKYCHPWQHYWFHTPSRPRWATWTVTWAVSTGLAAAALGLLLRDNGHIQSPFDILPAPARHPHVSLPQSVPHPALSIIAALPHVLVPTLYLTTNALLSAYFLSHQFSHYAHTGASLPLRVSSPNPRGAQTTSLYLTLPRPYSWLLFAVFVPLSLFLSFSFHPVAVAQRPLRTGPGVSEKQDVHVIVPDAVPLVVVLCLLVLVFGLVGLLAMRRVDASPMAYEDGAPAGNPLVLEGGSCSAVVSARSHRLPEDVDAAEGLLGWGVLREGDEVGVGQAGFSTTGVGKVDLRRVYE